MCLFDVSLSLSLSHAKGNRLKTTCYFYSPIGPESLAELLCRVMAEGCGMYVECEVSLHAFKFLFSSVLTNCVFVGKLITLSASLSAAGKWLQGVTQNT